MNHVASYGPNSIFNEIGSKQHERLDLMDFFLVYHYYPNMFFCSIVLDQMYHIFWFADWRFQVFPIIIMHAWTAIMVIEMVAKNLERYPI